MKNNEIRKSNIGTLSTTFAVTPIDGIMNILKPELEKLAAYKNVDKAQLGYGNNEEVDRFVDANPELRHTAFGMLRLEKSYQDELGIAKAGKFDIPEASYRKMVPDVFTFLSCMSRAENGKLAAPDKAILRNGMDTEEVLCNEIDHNKVIARTRMPNETADGLTVSTVINPQQVPVVMLRKLGLPCTEENCTLIKEVWNGDGVMTSAWAQSPIALNADWDGDKELVIENQDFVSEVIKTHMIMKPIYTVDVGSLENIKTVETTEEDEDLV